MLSAFHVSTWGLELSLDLAVRTDGPVDLMNRPPPVVSSGNPDDVGSNFDWIVQVRSMFCLHSNRRCCRNLHILPFASSSEYSKRSKNRLPRRGFGFSNISCGASILVSAVAYSVARLTSIRGKAVDTKKTSPPSRPCRGQSAKVGKIYRSVYLCAVFTTVAKREAEADCSASESNFANPV